MRKEERSSVVSFRLETDELQLLAERAARLGVSRHALARFYVEEALGAPSHITDLGGAVSHLQSEIQGQREDLALSVEALLSSAGKTSAKEAKSWAEQFLNRRPPCSPSQTR